MLNIVIPMAGRGSRFLEAGFSLPKPLIPVFGRPMIEVVVNNLRPQCEHRFIFLCLQEHVAQYRMNEKLACLAPGSQIVEVSAVTEGAACTVLLAQDFINSPNPLMIANSDQWVHTDINDYLTKQDETGADGLIMTMWADHPKWSYIRLGAQGECLELVEKEVVSNEATVGIYNFRHGADFVWAAQRMIQKNLRVNNEFYVAPTYNELITTGKKIVYYNVGHEYAGMYGLGIPSDLALFEQSEVLRQAVLSSESTRSGTA